jgi:SAM-dependent methyltransferase
MTDELTLQDIYARRFIPTHERRRAVWSVLVRRVFQPEIEPSASVLDLGCGYGEFINQIQAERKYAMDLNPDAAGRLAADVTFLRQDCATPWALEPGSLDWVVTSNFFEHLPTKQCLKDTLAQAYQALKPGGRIWCMGPNIDALPGKYWDFWDHHIPLSDLSLTEILALKGFVIEQSVPRFLPYTMVGGPSYPLWMVEAYLLNPWAWPLLGRQFLVRARKPVPSP